MYVVIDITLSNTLQVVTDVVYELIHTAQKSCRAKPNTKRGKEAQIFLLISLSYVQIQGDIRQRHLYHAETRRYGNDQEADHDTKYSAITDPTSNYKYNSRTGVGNKNYRLQTSTPYRCSRLDLIQKVLEYVS